MADFLEQPASFRMGSALSDEMSVLGWTQVLVASAWVRRSGTSLLVPELKKFLQRGGSAVFVAGLDMGQTTKEGLEDLLNLKQFGSIEIFVFHDESGPVFHPKIYLFQDGTNARLLVGSSNLTAGGLYTNIEALLATDGPLVAPSMRDALAAFTAWTDTSSSFVKSLDALTLQDLANNGYICTEATLRVWRKTNRMAAQRSTLRLFGASHTTAPKKPRPPSTIAQPGTTIIGSPGQAIIMRVRTARGTQVQIPFKVWRDPFFNGVTSVISSHDGTTRAISTAHARGKPNTAKVELPETASTVVPIVRLEHTANGLEYHVYDGAYGLGAIIFGQLNAGLSSSPATTMASISDLSRATLWKFI